MRHCQEPMKIWEIRPVCPSKQLSSESSSLFRLQYGARSTTVFPTIEERLDLIQRLKKKHGNAVEDILEVANRLKAELEILDTAQEIV